jgi:hypothetical protein
LLSQGWTVLLLDETIILALYTLESAALAIRELSIEALSDLLPFLTKIYPMIPNEIHLFFVILWSWRATTLRDGRRTA